MNIQQNVSLAAYSTMHLGGVADFLVEVHSHWEMDDAWKWARDHVVPFIVIGSGSNIVWRDEGFRGLIIVNHITGYEDYTDDAKSHYITVGAGEVWDSVVARTVEAGLTGIEALSLIPGTAGATPVQNVGAYGQEVAQTITSVEVFDAISGKLTNLPVEDCGFAYRHSKFQDEYRERYIITGVTFHLMAGNPEPPYYSAVQQYFEEHHITGPATPRTVRDAVVAIRTAKLPDPAVVANNGSFFANPIIKNDELIELRARFPDLPCWPTDDGGGKIPAAWLIEHAGFKDVHDEETGMATWAAQPLVLVNEKAKSTADLLRFRDKIIAAVQSQYGITLRQEPELLPRTNII